MASLFNTKISETYSGLIKTLDTTAVTTATLKLLSDGNGTSLGLSVNNQGDFKVNAILEWGSLKDTGTGITITNFVDSTATLASNKNDTTIPTSKAVSDYVDAQVGASDLDFSGDTGTGAVILSSETFAVTGTANQIETTASGTGLSLSLPSTVQRDLQGNVTGNLTGDVTGNVTGNVTGDLTGDSAGTHTGAVVGNVTGNVTGDLTGIVTATSSLADGVTATSQAVADDSTKVATTAFVQDVVGTIPAGLVFQGTWNADTNTPTLASGTGTTGHFYIVSVAGSTDLDGITDWKVGDWAVFVEQGASDQWEKVDNSSVLDGNGTGGKISKWAGSGNSVTLTDSIITESGSNIGIGMTPTKLLDIQATDNLALRYYNSTSFKAGIEVATTDGDMIGSSVINDLAIRSQSNMLFATGGITERMRIDSAGAIKFNAYGAGTLVADASGNITSISGGGEGGPYLPLAGGTLTGDLLFNDNVKAKFGTSSDLEIYHDGNHSYITDSGTGSLYIQGSGSVQIESPTAENMAVFTANGASELYYDNAKKFETTSQGISVTNTGANAFIKINREDATTSGALFLQSSNGTNGINSNGVKDLKISTNNTERMRITAAGDVGIGLTNPATPLNVQGIIRSNGNTSSADFYSTGNDALIVNNGNANLRFWNNGSEKMRIDSSGNVLVGKTSNLVSQDGVQAEQSGLFAATRNGNNVAYFNRRTSEGSVIEIRKDNTAVGVIGTENWGIGTSAPTRQLQINNSAAAATSLRVTNGAASISTGGDFGLSSGGDLAVWHNDNLGILFGTNNTERMRINSSGNVGINVTPATTRTLLVKGQGTTSSTAAFQVNDGNNADVFVLKDDKSATFEGDVTISNASAPILRLTNTTGSQSWIQYVGSNDDFIIRDETDARSPLIINGSGDSTFAGDVLISGSTKEFAAKAGAKLAFEDATPLGTIRVYNDGGAVSRLNIGDAMWVQEGLNVGIGTSAPVAKFEVTDGSSSITLQEYSNGAAIFLDGVNGDFAGGDYYHILADGSSYLGLGGYGGGATPLNIDSLGQVGIGTSTPSFPLEVDGGTGDGVKIKAGNSSNDDSFLVADNADSTLLLVDGGGNCGIGTSAPASKLHVDGETRLTGGAFRVSTDSVIVTSSVYTFRDAVGINNVNGSSFASGTATMSIGAMSNDVSLITTGSIGIGTSTPDANAKLDVVGGRSYFDASNEYTLRLSKSGTVGGFIGTSALSTLGFYSSSGTERMRITSGGNLLVGKTVDDDNTNGIRLSQAGIISASRASNVALILNRTGSDGNIALIRNDGTQVGSISVSGSATAYNTSSDYRLKENVVEMTGALDRVAQLKPSRFNFIADSDTTVDGFLAHEVQSVVPEAITGTKDGMRDEEYEKTPAVYDGDELVTEAVMATRSVEDYQGIDQSKLVPLLVGAIQELQARIKVLESK